MSYVRVRIHSVWGTKNRETTFRVMAKADGFMWCLDPTMNGGVTGTARLADVCSTTSDSDTYDPDLSSLITEQAA